MQNVFNDQSKNAQNPSPPLRLSLVPVQLICISMTSGALPNPSMGVEWFEKKIFELSWEIWEYWAQKGNPKPWARWTKSTNL
jgi:hypothetical protein